MGIIWQGRYFSSASDEVYAYQAIRYVELNPVRAKMVTSAVDYEWSSARVHSGLEESELLARLPTQYQPSRQSDWLSYLNENEDADLIAVIRRNIEKGLPCGNEDFISKLEKVTHRALTFKPVGRPKKG